MRPKIKTSRKKASKLHGATATYVSVVDRGANETPFTMIKSANGASAMGIKTRKKVASKKSHKAVNSGAKKNDATAVVKTETIMAKMVFDGDVFETEQKVIDWIAEAEWDAEDVNITKNDEGDFEARPNGLEDDDFEKLGEVDAEQEGVKAFVGERAIEDDDDDGEEKLEKDDDDEADLEADDQTPEEIEAAKAGETDVVDATGDEIGEDAEGLLLSNDKKKPAKKVVKLSKRAAFLKKRNDTRVKEAKFDSWDAHFSKGNTLATVLKDGMKWDGVPPGYYEVAAAFNSAVGNIVSGDPSDAGKQADLNAVALQYAEVIGGLDTFFDAFVEADEETIAKLIEDDDEQRDHLAKWANGYGDFVDTQGVAEVETKTVAKKSADKTDNPAIDYSNVASIVAKAVAPLAESVKAVTGTVEALASRRPTKKAVGADDTGSAATKLKKDEDDAQTGADFVREKQSKGLLG